LSLLVPTHREDRPLRRCLDSVAAQLTDADELIVVGDTHDGPLPGVESLVRDYGPQFRYLAYDAGHHCYGHCNLNWAIPQAKGDYVHLNDDDDVWAPDALDSFRRNADAVREPVPFLFRFKSYVGMIFWAHPGLFARDWIGAHCLLAPRERIGRFGCQYNGDFDYVEQTVGAYGGPNQAIWREEIVAIARPS
jgi:glycosyltransferase involved in cell wall biosynthesis